MSEYIFENKDKKMFEDCTGDEMKQIVEGANDGSVELFNSSAWYPEPRSTTIFLHNIYRVRSPTPNQIDWSLVPPEFKHCYVNPQGLVSVTVRLPIEISRDGELGLWYCGTGGLIMVGDFDFGFVRGTVKSIDSLLIRPIGE